MLKRIKETANSGTLYPTVSDNVIHSSVGVKRHASQRGSTAHATPCNITRLC